VKTQISLFGLIFFFTSVTVSAQVETPRQMQGYRDYLDSHLAPHMTTERAGQANTSTVSLQQLQHKIPKEAQKEQKKASDAIRKGDNQLALLHMQNAVKIDPEFADVYNDLGVVLGWLGHMDQAAEQFQRAIELVPDHYKAVKNLSIALYMLGRCDEALPVARRALRIDPAYEQVHYVLGFCLVAENGDTVEALTNLERAAGDFPKARLVASEILAESGRRDEAAQELEKYLDSVPLGAAGRKKVEEQIAQLRQ